MDQSEVKLTIKTRYRNISATVELLEAVNVILKNPVILITTIALLVD